MRLLLSMLLSWQIFVMSNNFVTSKLLLLRQTCVLSWQKYACHDKTFVTMNICLSQQIFVATTFVTKYFFCRNKHNFVTTKVLSRQAYFCCDKRCVLSWQPRVCRNKTFVTTKMILVAAPTNDSKRHWSKWWPFLQVEAESVRTARSTEECWDCQQKGPAELERKSDYFYLYLLNAAHMHRSIACLGNFDSCRECPCNCSADSPHVTAVQIVPV